MKAIVLGASGMLGSMVLDYLSRVRSLELAATARDAALLERFKNRIPDVPWHLLDAERCALPELQALLGDANWAINAIGVIKPYIHDDNPTEVERAVRINALFPHILARAAEATGCKVLQIATDCVFSGETGDYLETAPHDALDAYGKTKSLGEVWSPLVHHLRCSIIGPEPKGHVSLLDWFLAQPKDGTVTGYQNHRWNGVTTLHFAKLCYGIMSNSLALPHVHHVVPDGAVAKAELLKTFARECGRGDLTVTPADAKTPVDRTLATADTALNLSLWQAAGYSTLPSIPEMIAELARFPYRFKERGCSKS